MRRIAQTKTWIIIIAFLMGSLLTIGGVMVFIHPTDRVVQTWKQPDDIEYDSFGPYYLSVVEDDMDISRLPFSAERRYYIYIGRDSGKPTHGHVIEYSFHPDSNDLYNIAAHISKSKIIWATDGVTFEEASGHKIFISKSSIGGR